MWDVDSSYLSQIWWLSPLFSPQQKPPDILSENDDRQGRKEAEPPSLARHDTAPIRIVNPRDRENIQNCISAGRLRLTRAFATPRAERMASFIDRAVIEPHGGES